MTLSQQQSAARTSISMARSGRHKTIAAGLAMTSLLLLGSAFGADLKAAGNASLEASYQREKASCTNGQSNEDRATCLREAGAAYQAAKQGTLDNPATTPYRKNALERCKILPTADQADCRRRIDNPGDVEGSVSAGGILRKDVTIVPAPAR